MPRKHARAGVAIVAVALAACSLVALAPAAARADTSGLDASGYAWVDSNEPSPSVTFDWVDATGGTLSHISDDDDETEAVTLPFGFVFFGVEYSELEISTNGFLSFAMGSECNDNYNWDDTLAENSGHPVPFTDLDCELDSGWGGNPLIAAWFDDLDPSNCGDVYYDTLGSAPDRVLVVEYQDVCHNRCDECGPSDGITLEVMLFEGSNDIKMQYADTFFGDFEADLAAQNGGATATTGIGKDGDVGLGYSWAGTPPLTDGLAVLYTTDDPEAMPTPSPTAVPSPTASPTPAPASNDASAGTAAVLEEAQGPAALPDTGGGLERDGSATARATIAGVLTAIGLGVLWTALRLRVR